MYTLFKTIIGIAVFFCFIVAVLVLAGLASMLAVHILQSLGVP